MIHVAYGTSNLYAKFAGTSMLSIFENTTENVTVHILHDNSFTQENQEKFIQVAERCNQQVKFYNVEKLCAEEIAEFQTKFVEKIEKRLSAAPFFRILLPKIIAPSIEKIIYLDADTVVNLDINELWSIDLQGKPFAAAVHKEDCSELKFCRNGIVKPTDFFNSGVMFMNLEELRQKDDIIRNGMEFISNNPQYDDGFMDQGILNYCFSTQYLKLPLRFNEFVRTERDMRVDEAVQTERTKGKNILESKIYHYTLGYLVYGLDVSDVYNRLFWETFMKTPWFSIEIFGHIFTFLKNEKSEQERLLAEQERLMNEHEKLLAEQKNEYKKQIIDFSAFMSGKTRTFLTNITNFEKLKQGFSIKDNEEIILLTADTPVIQLVDSMKALHDKKIFFLLFSQIEIYIALRNLLKERGLIEGKDFINTVPLVIKSNPEPKEISKEVPLDQWEIIKNL